MAARQLYVKICGITRVEDAKDVVSAGADAIGLNFVPGSKRRIDFATARRIADEVRGQIEIVAVVANLSLDEQARIRREVVVDWLQLHGDETPEVLALAQPNAFKAARIGDASDVAAARHFGGDRILADAKVQGESGGTGLSFDWALVQELARERPLLLAGGLRPDNVRGAVATVRPFGVDVASGVETCPGVKDLAKVREFVHAARTA